jgi:hypothetical protein
VCVANPLTLRALDVGHPEELLGGALCAGAALAALRDRSLLAGLLLGLALGNKAWAVLAVLPVLLALPAGGRVRALCVAVPVAGVLVAPVLFGGAATVVASSAHTTGVIFQPWQLWWFLGDHGHVIRGVYEEKVGYRAAPGWISPVGHPLVVVAGAGVAAAWALVTRGGGRARGDALGLLALVLGIRCVLDPWNTDYYALPCVLALVAWEAGVLRRVPVFAVFASLLTYLTIFQLPDLASPDLQAAAYLGWAVPGLLFLALRLARPRGAKEPVRAPLPGTTIPQGAL